MDGFGDIWVSVPGAVFFRLAGCDNEKNVHAGFNRISKRWDKNQRQGPGNGNRCTKLEIVTGFHLRPS